MSQRGIFVVAARRVEEDGEPIVGGGVVGALIAMDAEDERRSVGLPHTDLAGISGHSPRTLRQAEERQGGNQQFT